MSFFQKTDNVTTTTHAFIKALGVKANYNYLKEKLLENINYPSLLAVSEILDGYQIENYAAELSPDDLLEVPLPCLAALNTEGGIFVLVNKVENGLVDWWHFKKGRQKDTIKSFVGQWNNVLLLARPSALSLEPKYAQNYRKELIYNGFNWLVTISIIIIFFAIFYLFISTNTFLISLLFLIKFLGCIIGALLLWRLIDKKNALIKSVCEVNSNINCDSVLDSKAATIGGVVSWSEIGFFYFLGGFLSLLLGLNHPPIIHYLLFLNLLALPYTVFSIYYQGFFLKQWCILCLITQLMLWIEFLIFSNSVGFSYSNIYDFNGLLILTISFLLPIVFWFSLKPILQKTVDINFYKSGMKSFQDTASVFFTLLREQRQVTDLPNGIITDGNLSSQNTILTVTHPYCSHCATGHLTIKQIISQKSVNIKSQLVFVSSNNEADKSSIFIKHLFSLDPILRNEALDFWFEQGNRNYESWSQKYPVNKITDEAVEIVQQHRHWFQQNKIERTPTFFINNFSLPKIYKIKDINRIASRIFS
jgi:uncharacterized membrane protein